MLASFSVLLKDHGEFYHYVPAGMGLGAVQMSDLILASAVHWDFVCVVLKGGSTEGKLASVGSLDCGMSLKQAQEIMVGAFDGVGFVGLGIIDDYRQHN